VIPLAFPGITSAALFAFLASFDELIISLFLAGVRAQTLPVRIWNSLHLDIEPVVAAVSAFLIAVTVLFCCSTALSAVSAAGCRRVHGNEQFSIGAQSSSATPLAASAKIQIAPTSHQKDD
jgi:ABC-type Fe3+ transport system permease subunit